jgi:hypothetical protein
MNLGEHGGTTQPTAKHGFKISSPIAMSHRRTKGANESQTLMVLLHVKLNQ